MNINGFFWLIQRVQQILLLPIILFSCQTEYHKNNSHKNVSSSSIEKGDKLARLYCQSCHLMPDPSLANSSSWENGILPNMGPRLGIFYYGFQEYPSFKNDWSLGKNFYPAEPILNSQEWQNIIDYYTATSPDTMQGQNRPNVITKDLSSFTIKFPSFLYPDATTSFVHVDTTGKPHKLIICDVIKKLTFFLDKNLNIIDSVPNSGPIVNMDFEGENLLACDIGILNPNNGKHGKGEIIKKGIGGKLMDSVILFDSLQRPVQIATADLNDDGKPDYLICEFGYITGSLSWMENKGNSTFARHLLRPTSGAIKAYINDFNNDGLLDIIVLFAQGDESIILFTNKGNGEFAQEQVLRFPPSYGSSYFELDDFNKDGFPDIVYTCGDNADYSPVLKPYHGVYIFMNDGSNHFTQKYFFPINGCYKAMARDFDNDGDLDIAAISFFADYAHQPEEGFVYLKNTGGLNFLPYSVPGTEAGRWLTMDAGDIDGDGKTDIILGNFSIAPQSSQPKNDWKKGPPFMVLKNIGK